MARWRTRTLTAVTGRGGAVFASRACIRRGQPPPPPRGPSEDVSAAVPVCDAWRACQLTGWPGEDTGPSTPSDRSSFVCSTSELCAPPRPAQSPRQTSTLLHSRSVPRVQPIRPAGSQSAPHTQEQGETGSHICIPIHGTTCEEY